MSKSQPHMRPPSAHQSGLPERGTPASPTPQQARLDTQDSQLRNHNSGITTQESQLKTQVSRLKTHLSSAFPPLLILTLAVVAWQVYVTAARVPDFILPSPSGIWRSFVDQHDVLIQNTWPTVKIALGGYLLAVAVGLILAVAIYSFRWLELALYPLVIGSQAVPFVAFAPVLVIIFGYDLAPKLI